MKQFYNKICSTCIHKLECEGQDEAHWKTFPNQCKEYQQFFYISTNPLNKSYNSMTTEEKIKVMQAYIEGRKIQRYHPTFNKWIYDDNPKWNWDKYDYQVIKEPRYKPYNSAEEFLQASKEHGPMVCYKNTIYKQPIQIDDRLEYPIIFSYSLDKVLVDRTSYRDLLNFYKWQDGTNCGILEDI